MADELNEFETSFRTPWTTTVESLDGLQRKLVEQRIHTEQLELLGSAVHVTAEGIAILTPAVEAIGPRIAFINEGFCSMYGLRRSDVIGETPAVFGIVERHQAIYDGLLRHVFDETPFKAEATAVRHDGSEFELDLELVPGRRRWAPHALGIAFLP